MKWRRGYSWAITTIVGLLPVEGYADESETWGVRRSPSPPVKWWILDHIPTGCFMATASTMRECKAIAEQLAALDIDWSIPRSDVYTKDPDILRQVSTVLAPLEPVG